MQATQANQPTITLGSTLASAKLLSYVVGVTGQTRSMNFPVTPSRVIWAVYSSLSCSVSFATVVASDWTVQSDVSLRLYSCGAVGTGALNGGDLFSGSAAVYTNGTATFFCDSCARSAWQHVAGLGYTIAQLSIIGRGQHNRNFDGCVSLYGSPSPRCVLRHHSAQRTFAC